MPTPFTMLVVRPTVIALALILAAGCEKSRPPPDPNDVYRAVLRMLAGDDAADPPFELHVVWAFTTTMHMGDDGEPASWADLRESLPALQRDTYEDYRSRNREPSRITLRRAVGRPVHRPELQRGRVLL